jgi:hypothetical protein
MTEVDNWKKKKLHIQFLHIVHAYLGYSYLSSHPDVATDDAHACQRFFQRRVENASYTLRSLRIPRQKCPFS